MSRDQRPGRSRLTPTDALVVGFTGLRSRPLRAALSALGIAVGIAAAVAVLGISASSQANLLDQLGREGNLLTVAAGRSLSGAPAPLPPQAAGMIGRIPPVQRVTATALVPGATVRRTAAVPTLQTGGISVAATGLDLLNTVDGRVARGAFLNAATSHYPAVVLGAAAAQTLGIDAVPPGTQVYIGTGYFSVVGILDPVSIAPEIDQSALVGFPAATSLLGLAAGPTQIYLRCVPDQVRQVAAVLPFTADPASPEAVQVRRPSDLLAARAQAKTEFTGLFVGLGAVALFVGAVGIANVMVVSVLERRGEIGLRRALGAKRVHIAVQFIVEAAVLAALGGLAGILLGAAGTAGYAVATSQQAVLPLSATLPAAAAAPVVGILAGLYPALRAARLDPATALASP
ncbi:ABC transporter permease [Specibacter cremeus]|uniref:ABC transporter permease n=1 Tax=Specibacter cremeus TaxID=1629051 RepID=UPI000F7A1A72|nr:ABC transporter permease [Specibacter cremeus]